MAAERTGVYPGTFDPVTSGHMEVVRRSLRLVDRLVIGPAINIGDYLIGLGYRLVNSCRGDLGADVASDIVESMSQAHLQLCDGQGAEMAWRDHPDWWTKATLLR